VDPDDLTLAGFTMNLETGEIMTCPEGHAPETQKPIRDGQGMNLPFDRANMGGKYLEASHGGIAFYFTVFG
jgi:hypothetical protein